MLRRDDDDVLSPDERAALKALYPQGPPFWIPRSVFDPIHASHRTAHPAPPKVDELVRDGDGFVAPSALNGEDGFLLPLHRSTEGGVLFLPEFERGGELMATRPRASRQRPRPERQLVTIAIDDARATERNAATAERELPRVEPARDARRAASCL